MEKVNLAEDLELVGIWYVTNDRKAIPGALHYSASKGIRLKLEGQFDTPEPDTIWGFAGGQEITLFDCFCTSFSIYASEFQEYYPTEIVANKMLIGSHFQNEESITIEKVIFETSNIKPWTLISGFTKTNDLENHSFTMSYKLPKDVTIYESDELKIELKTRANTPASFLNSEEVIIREINFFEIQNTPATAGLSFFRHIDAIRKFISLAARHAVEVTNIRFKPSGSENYVHCITRFTDICLDHANQIYHHRNMFFTLQDISNICERYEKWQNFLLKSPEPANLYFSKTNGILHNIFLTKAQALEEIHRQLHPKPKDVIYRQRITDLFEKHTEIMSRTGDKNAFAQLVLDHRDYFTHWFEKKKDRIIPAQKLDYLTRDVNLLLELCLLETMGFTPSEIKAMIENCFDYIGYLLIGRPPRGDILQPERHTW